MKTVKYSFSNQVVHYYFETPFGQLKKLVDKKNTILVTDENIYGAHGSKFKGWKTIVLKPGEKYKTQDTVNSILEQLIAFEADRKTMLVGVGGGVVTDITGYAASVYMRGIPFGFVPTTLLAMVDASIGGKNGIDVGVYKNMVGVIRQPQFLLYDVSLLKTLPLAEWINGCAEIIKHACIKDAAMFRMLEQHSLDDLQKSKKILTALVERNARLKSKVVQQDEFEKGDRKLLNFGHTLGHAIENLYGLSHGQAVAVGMTYAALLSHQQLGFKQQQRIVQVLEQYGLPTSVAFEKQQVFNVLKMDKKRDRTDINFILLEKLGKGVIKKLPLRTIEEIL